MVWSIYADPATVILLVVSSWDCCRHCCLWRNTLLSESDLVIYDSEEYICIRELEVHLTASLKNLQMEYVDLYYLHRINPNMPMEEVAGAFGKLIEEGLIRGWGMSQVSAKQLDQANRITPVTAVQKRILENLGAWDVSLSDTQFKGSGAGT